jgi:hypothetical protein
MVGNWRTVMTEDGVEVGIATHQRRWSPDKNALIMTWKDNLKGGAHSSTAVSGWNAKEKAIVEHWYGSDGSYGVITYPLEKMTQKSWEGTHRWVMPDGKVTSGECRLEKGNSQWVFTADWEVEGKRVKVENLTKKTGQRHAKATAEDYLKFAEYWIGEWKATYETTDPEIKELLGGEKSEGDVIIKWSAGNRCHDVKVFMDGELKRHALWGFDGATRRWRGLAFNADGAYVSIAHSPQVLDAKYGKPFTSRVTGSKADGTPATGQWSTTLIDEDTYENKLYDIRNGKKELILSIRLERK